MNIDKQPLVSICCVSYNHAEYIPEAIKSFWNQEYKNIEILALDDGSTDGSLAILQDMQKQSPCPMTVVGQENTGRVSYNFNKLLKQAKGKYAGIIALDDFLYPTAISEKVALMENDDDIAFAFNSAITFVDADSKPYKEDHLSLFGKQNATADDILENEFNMDWTYYCQGTFYRTDVLKAVGYLDEELLADDYALRIRVALWLRAHPAARFANLDNPACFYRRHPNNISRNYLRQALLIRQVLDKYWSDRKLPPAFMRMTRNLATVMDFKAFRKIRCSKDEKSPFVKELLLYLRVKFKAFRRKMFRVRLSKNKKVIQLFGITFYQKGNDDD